MKQILDKLTSKEAMAVIAKVEVVFKDLPHLPKGLVKFLVKIAPWLVGLGGIISLLGGISTVFGASRADQLLVQFGEIGSIDPMYFTLSGVIEIVSGLLMLMAFKPLKSHDLDGWVYLFWNGALGLVSSALGIYYGLSSLIAVVIGTAIGYYILFELKSSYKSK